MVRPFHNSDLTSFADVFLIFRIFFHFNFWGKNMTMSWSICSDGGATESIYNVGGKCS